MVDIYPIQLHTFIKKSGVLSCYTVLYIKLQHYFYVAQVLGIKVETKVL